MALFGKPKEGDGRASLFRALCETEEEALGKALLSQWDVNPRILSKYLSGACKK